MDKLVRKKYIKIFVSFMALILAFGTLFNTTSSYAAEADPSGQTPGTPAPKNLQHVSKTDQSIIIKWDQVDGIDSSKTGYLVSYGSVSESTYEVPVTGTEYTITKLKPDTEYTISVKANVDGALASTIKITTNKAEPSNQVGPTNLRVVKTTHNTVSLEWDPAPGITAYWIWDKNNKYILWANNGAQTVGGLTPETEYTFYVGPDGVQAPNLKPEQKSNLVTFTTTKDVSQYEEAPLSPPHNLRVASLTDGSVTLNWDGSPGANGYDFYVNGAWISTIWNDTNSATYKLPVDGDKKGTVYTFLVGAQKMPKVSAKSNAVTLSWGQLAAPRDVQIVSGTRTALALGWAATPGATSYDIYRNDVRIGSSNTNHFADTKLIEGTTYTYKIVAKNSLWESSASEPLNGVPGSNYNIVTYYTSWSGAEGARNYKPTDIDVSQVTHINYAFADLCWKKFGTGTIACQDENVPLQKDYVFDGEMVIGDHEVDIENFKTFGKIRDENPHLKIMVSVGGWSWSKNFSNMAKDEVTRLAFANSVVKFLRTYELDGVDIDWEYPVEGGELTNSRGPEDTENFTLLVKTVREALDAAGAEDGKYYLQTIASAQGDNFVVNADLANSVNYLDFINIMTYDYSGSWETLAHHNAPLYYDKAHPDPVKGPRLNMLGGVSGHLNGGVPEYKLVVGVPFYGKGWSGCPENGQYQTCESGTAFGTWESGIFDYTDIEENYLDKNGYVNYFNEVSKAAYVYNKDEKVFITYNDKTSMMYISSFVKSLDLAGVMSWEVSGDRNLTLSTQLVKDLPIDGAVHTTALSAPQNLVSGYRNENSIQINWDAVAGAAGYEVFVNNKYVNYTTKTEFNIADLGPSTEYIIHIIAIRKENDKITEVSVATKNLAVTTTAKVNNPVVVPPTTTQVSDLETSVTKAADKWTVTVLNDAAVKKIQSSQSTAFNIVVDKEAKSVEVIIPKEVIEEAKKKGDKAVLSVNWNGVVYNVPVQQIKASGDIKITIQPAGSDQVASLAKEQDFKVLVQPLDFKIEQLNADKVYVEITDFANTYISRSFTFNAKDVDLQKAAGVVYIPGTNMLRSVPTLFKLNTDGTVTAELKRNGNSIYAVIQSDFSFKDVTSGWAQKDINRAVAKLIASGDSTEQFGASRVITREEVVSLIVKGLGILPDSASSPFKDVDPKSKYAGDISAASKAGLIKGKTEDTFDPNGSITRQDFAVLLANAISYAGHKTDANVTVLERFADHSTISSYAKAPLALLVDQGIIQGVSETKVSPKTNLTKAQAVVALMRLLDQLSLSN